MTPQEIKLGTRLELELLNKYKEWADRNYVSQLLEIQRNGAMVISAPIYEARLIFIPLQSQIRLAFIHNEHGLLGFNALVTGCEYKGNIAVLVIQTNSEVYRMQRRDHYRLDYITDIVIRLAEKDTGKDKERKIKAITKNISGSGLCVVTGDNIPRNTELKAELRLSDGININAKCIVMRNSALEIMKTKKYELGLKFTSISKKNQDSLIRFIYEQQRLRLKKESQ